MATRVAIALLRQLSWKLWDAGLQDIRQVEITLGPVSGTLLLPTQLSMALGFRMAPSWFHKSSARSGVDRLQGLLRSSLGPKQPPDVQKIPCI